MFNVVFILCTVVLVPVFERVGVPTVMALSAGMLLGGLAQVVVQWPVLRQEGYRHQWILDPRDRGVREVLILMGPATLGLAAAQINMLVSTSLATGQDGAAAALGYAFRLIYVPIGIVGVSVATAAIPELAGHAASAALKEMRATVSWSLRLMLMLSVPAVVGLMALSGPIVELLFERYQFGPQSRALVADALFFYAPGILGYSAVKIASPGFYSLKDARTPATVSAISIVVNLVLNLWLNSTRLQFLGLALGTAIAANVNAGLLLAADRRRGRRAGDDLVSEDSGRVDRDGRGCVLLGDLAAWTAPGSVVAASTGPRRRRDRHRDCDTRARGGRAPDRGIQSGGPARDAEEMTSEGMFSESVE
jgi:putative peptidoglycan lipid II flippase